MEKRAIIPVRLTPDQREAIDAYAKANGTTRAAVLREAALDRVTQPEPSREAEVAPAVELIRGNARGRGAQRFQALGIEPTPPVSAETEGEGGES